MRGREVLHLHGVSAGYRDVAIIHQIDLELGSGDSMAVIGANGAGKTTLLRVIMGEIPAMSGEVLFNEMPISRLPTYRRAKLGIGYAPEGRQLFPAMTVSENLELGASRLPSRERSRRLCKVLEVFPKLAPLLHRHCGLLSGGEQQMVAVGRAIMGGPRLLLLDEPSTGLAPRVVLELYASLGLLHETGISILVVEQNAKAVLKFARRALVFEDGRIVASGLARDLMNDPRVIQAYVRPGTDFRSLNAGPIEGQHK